MNYVIADWGESFLWLATRCQTSTDFFFEFFVFALKLWINLKRSVINFPIHVYYRKIRKRYSHLMIHNRGARDRKGIPWLRCCTFFATNLFIHAFALIIVDGTLTEILRHSKKEIDGVSTQPRISFGVFQYLRLFIIFSKGEQLDIIPRSSCRIFYA